MGIDQIDGQAPAYQPNFVEPPSASKATEVRSSPVPFVAPSTTLHERTPVPQPSSAQLEKATAQAQAQLRGSADELTFSIDKESGKTVVKLIDTATQKVIRQIPSKEMLAIADSLDKALQGSLIDQKA